MDKSEAIASVDDAIRKLVQLSSKEKVWAQEVLLQVNDKSLRLLDVESQVLDGNSSCRELIDRGRARCPVHPDVCGMLVRGREWSQKRSGKAGPS